MNDKKQTYTTFFNSQKVDNLESSRLGTGKENVYKKKIILDMTI